MKYLKSLGFLCVWLTSICMVIVVMSRPRNHGTASIPWDGGRKVNHNESNCGIEFTRPQTHVYAIVERMRGDVQKGLVANAQMLHRIQTESGVPLVIMHGSLIGWWWNQETLPWDDDIDIVLTDPKKFQMWLFSHPTRLPIPVRREHPNDKYTFYQLKDRNFAVYFDNNQNHHVEYRLIHLPTGVYTDICIMYKTYDKNVLRSKKVSRPSTIKWPLWAMKATFKNIWGGHLYNDKDMFPLKKCNLNGYSLHCPANVDSVLKQEYRNFKSPIVNHKTVRAVFDRNTNCWHPPK